MIDSRSVSLNSSCEEKIFAQRIVRGVEHGGLPVYYTHRLDSLISIITGLVL